MENSGLLFRNLASPLRRLPSTTLCIAKNGLASFFKKTAVTPMCERTALLFSKLASRLRRLPSATLCIAKNGLASFFKKMAEFNAIDESIIKCKRAKLKRKICRCGR